MSVARICGADSPLRCEGRARAMDAGDFKYVWQWGWVWWKAMNPTVPFEACPWCGGPLPQMDRIVDRGLREGFDALHLPDGFSGEDGG